MRKSLESYFDEFITDRIIDIDQQVISNDKKIKALKKDCIDLFNKIQECLPAEDKSLIFEYEEKTNEMDALHVEMIYKKSFIDGINAAMMFKEVSNRDTVKV